jgi:hypothetical protein
VVSFRRVNAGISWVEQPGDYANQVPITSATEPPRFPAGGSVGEDLGGLRAALRERLGREASPSAGVIDSQSLKSGEKGDARKVKQTQWVMMPARR